MVWPLAGAGQIISGFGAGRDQGSRHHQGIDISAPKLTPVVAVADGVVMSVTQVVGTEDCCWMSLRHDDGWQSYYVHLNNDRYGTDDGLGVGVRSDLVEGMEVAAGEVIGWLGDSGNAEETVDHIHFELRTSDGTAIDAEPSLRAAQRAAEVVDARTAWPYADDDGLDIEWLAASLLSEGLFLPCDDEMITFCPDRVASPGFAGEIVSHLTGKTPPTINGRYQTLPASLSPNRNLARTLEQAFGCAPIDECLEHGIPETELARIAAWVRVDAMVARLLPKRSVREGGHPDVNLPSAGDAETMLRSEGTLGECNPPLDPDQLLTREETLTLLVSWVRGANPEPCSRGVQGVR
jgi:murein DD-endopeptidase MepM/ murein hydrolase activator NlpD